MQIKSLQDINELPISQSESEIGERIEAVIEFTENNVSTPYWEAAETIVDIIGYASYMVIMPTKVEPVLLKWISETYEQNNRKYIDAISTIYANMSTNEAQKSLKKKIKESTNSATKELLIEALTEFEQ